ncbi:MAG: aminotransferase class IV family protein [Rudaea sp.]|uniref:aminotransferase class IV family protein n=1 Tax=Rudaea sp. TaxID=2136325 RepID=UPI0039E27902
MNATALPRMQLNGAPAGADDLRHLVQTNYGHFTALRVEQGGVRGLDLHLDRLQHATRALFGSELERERVRGYLRHAVAGDVSELSARVNVFAHALDRERLDRSVAVDVLVTVAPVSTRATAPLRVKSFRYARDLPAIKHVGTFALFHHRHLAQQAGFDDALFVDEDGRISEGSIWNVGFVDRDGAVVWPDAPQLDGVGMQLLKAGLAREGIAGATRPIRLSGLAAFRAAFFTNASVPVRAIASIDGQTFAHDDAMLETLARCYAANTPQPL